VKEIIRLHYHRPPDRTDIFEQELLHRSDDVLVTYVAATPLPHPVIIDDVVALEPGAPAIWFSFPGLMHDIGRFHTLEGRFTGLYANVILPIEIRSAIEWSATDLFVDVWIGVDGKPQILDTDELEHAIASGWITSEAGARAREEVDRIVASYQAGVWPPRIVNEWPIERVSNARH
jgi:predicted RNA-binding protein associated with RNAse of E/G family